MSKSRAAIERAQESASKKKSTVHGRYFIAEPRAIGGGELPTRDEWLEEQAIKSGTLKPASKFGSAPDNQNIVQGQK